MLIRQFQEKEEFVRKQNHLPLDIYCGPHKALIHLDRTLTLSKATEIIFNEIKKEFPEFLSNLEAVECVRVRKFNPDTGSKGRVRHSLLCDPIVDI